MKEGSRVIYLETYLSILNYNQAYEALKLVKKEMCKEKGFVRHTGNHYYYHLVDVAQKLLNAGVREEDIITAALLHDLVEDVLDEEGKPIYPIERLEAMFNAEVAHMVKLVTKDPKIDYKTDKEALKRYLAAIADHYGAALIKAADRQNNFGTLLEATSEKKIRTAIETETYYIPFFKTCRNRYPWFASFFFDAKTNIEPHLWSIKEHHKEVEALQKQLASLQKENEALKKQLQNR